MITPTLCVMDRLAAFVHCRDRQCYEQAVRVAENHKLDWLELEQWATEEKMEEAAWIQFAKLRDRVE